MAERIVAINGVDLCVETFGEPTDPAVLLIAGAAQSMDAWEVPFCARLAAEGRFVIRYDHRDTGRSRASPAGKPTYTEDDLTTDPLRVLDALGLAAAHLVGVSMGGGISQQLAATSRDRVLTATLIATSPAGERAGHGRLPSMEPRIAEAFEHPAPEPNWSDREAVVTYLVEAERPFAGSLGLDEERARRIAGIVVDRTVDIAASVTNHWLLAGDSSDPFRMADIHVPTLVMHGTTDPVFPFAHGEALAAEIPGATLIPLKGMGHEIPPPPLWDVVVAAIAKHTATRG